jgi:hypothetical protein
MPSTVKLNRPGLGPFAALLLVGGALVACDRLLEVEAPSRVASSVLDKPENARLLVGGAKASFACAFQAYINGVALLTDEMEDTQLAAAAWPWDRRDWLGALGEAYAEAPCDAGQIFGVYRPLQTARFAADDALKRLANFTDEQVAGRAGLQAQASLLAGYSRILLGEGFCSMAIDLGPELSPKEVFSQAEQVLTDAMAFARTAGDQSIENAARVGRARARLDLARLPGQPLNMSKYGEAAADAQLVPAGFVYKVAYISTTSYSRNNISFRNRNSLLYSVAPPYRNLGDPRVRVTNSGQRGADAVNTVWLIDKYPSQDSPIPLARYEEAQLIIAEAELAAGRPGNAVTVLNALRARPGVGLPPYTGPTDAASVQTFLISERSKELFLEGQHFWDINRFNLPLDPPAGTPYPGKGGTYADLRCLKLPDIERIYNPNLGK